MEIDQLQGCIFMEIDQLQSCIFMEIDQSQGCIFMEIDPLQGCILAWGIIHTITHLQSSLKLFFGYQWILSVGPKLKTRICKSHKPTLVVQCLFINMHYFECQRHYYIKIVMRNVRNTKNKTWMSAVQYIYHVTCRTTWQECSHYNLN